MGMTYRTLRSNLTSMNILSTSEIVVVRRHHDANEYFELTKIEEGRDGSAVLVIKPVSTVGHGTVGRLSSTRPNVSHYKPVERGNLDEETQCVKCAKKVSELPETVEFYIQTIRDVRGWRDDMVCSRCVGRL